MPTAQTHVRTDRASRYLVQLCEHLDQLGRSSPRHAGSSGGGRGSGAKRIEWTDRHGRVEFAIGGCDLVATDEGLTVRLTADDTDALQHLQDAFTARLETIGRRDRLKVDWSVEAR